MWVRSRHATVHLGKTRCIKTNEIHRLTMKSQDNFRNSDRVRITINSIVVHDVRKVLVNFCGVGLTLACVILQYYGTTAYAGSTDFDPVMANDGGPQWRVCLREPCRCANGLRPYRMDHG